MIFRSNDNLNNNTKSTKSTSVRVNWIRYSLMNVFGLWDSFFSYSSYRCAYVIMFLWFAFAACAVVVVGDIQESLDLLDFFGSISITSAFPCAKDNLVVLTCHASKAHFNSVRNFSSPVFDWHKEAANCLMLTLWPPLSFTHFLPMALTIFPSPHAHPFIQSPFLLVVFTLMCPHLLSVHG